MVTSFIVFCLLFTHQISYLCVQQLTTTTITGTTCIKNIIIQKFVTQGNTIIIKSKCVLRSSHFGHLVNNYTFSQ